MSAITASLSIALVGGPIKQECFNSIRERRDEFQVHEFTTGRQALRCNTSVDVWVVSSQLQDMDGVTCTELLNELHPDARYYLIAEQFNSADERHCFQLGSTKYLCTSMAAHWLLPLLRSQGFAEGSGHSITPIQEKANGHTDSQ